VRNRAEAEDLTSEVFREALAGLSRFEWRGVPFVAWLLGIAANVLSDRWTHLARQLAEGITRLGTIHNDA
jgi:DNA-directed RNA polymerase specialized sigma24 family protein